MITLDLSTFFAFATVYFIVHHWVHQSIVMVIPSTIYPHASSHLPFDNKLLFFAFKAPSWQLKQLDSDIKESWATTGMKNSACVLVLDLSKNWSPSLFLVFSFSYFTLKVKGPQFETGRRRSPASRGHELVYSHCWSHAWINRSVGHLAQKLCQIRFVDPSIVAARWEIRRQPKVPIRLNKYGSSFNRYLVHM